MVSINIRCVWTYQLNPVLTTHHVQVSWQERCAKILRRSYGGSHTVSVPLMRVRRVSHKFPSSKRQTSDTRRFRTDTDRGNTRALEKRGISSLSNDVETGPARATESSPSRSDPRGSSRSTVANVNHPDPNLSSPLLRLPSNRNFKEDARDFKRIPLQNPSNVNDEVQLIPPLAFRGTIAYDSSQATRPATR